MKFKPTMLYSLIKPFLLLILGISLVLYKENISVFMAINFKIDVIPYINVFTGSILFIYLYFVIYTYLIKYDLSEEQLNITKGIFSIHTDFLELYRIKDLDIKKPFYLRLIGVYNLTLYTSDKTHPIITIKGINIYNLSQNIRTLVEINRKSKRVYQVD